MTIYTRTGDAGETSLADGQRVRKDCPRVEAYGTVDEANSAVGFARAANTDAHLDELLHFVQQRLFNCSSSLAFPLEHETDKTPHISPDDIAALERAIDRFETTTATWQGFLLEAGCETATRLHMARTIVRRAERRIATLSAVEPVEQHVVMFINRLSDVLFAAARFANILADVPEEPWDPEAPRPEL